jgi:hypothetical protein
MVEGGMPKLAAKYNAADDYRRALRLLADGPDGHTEALMLAHGFTAALLANLIKSELVRAQRQRVKRHGRVVQVVRLRITSAGRKALA